MALVSVCDICHKRIKERPTVSAGVGFHSMIFHPACAPLLVKFLKRLGARDVETLSGKKTKTR